MEEFFNQNGKLSQDYIQTSSWTICYRAFRSFMDWATFMASVAFALYFAFLRYIFDFILDSRADGSFEEMSRIEPPEVGPTDESEQGSLPHDGNKSQPTTAPTVSENEPPVPFLYKHSPDEDVVYEGKDTENEILPMTATEVTEVQVPTSFKYESSDEEMADPLNKEEKDKLETANELPKVEQFQVRTTSISEFQKLNNFNTENETLPMTATEVAEVQVPTSFKYESSDEEMADPLCKEEKDQPQTAPELPKVEKLQFRSQEFAKEKTHSVLDEEDKRKTIDLVEESESPKTKPIAKSVKESFSGIAGSEVISGSETATLLPEASKTDICSFDEETSDIEVKTETKDTPLPEADSNGELSIYEVTEETSDLDDESETQAIPLPESDSKDESSLGELVVKSSPLVVEFGIQSATPPLESSKDAGPSDEVSATSSDIIVEPETQTEPSSGEADSKNESLSEESLLRITDLVTATETSKAGVESKNEDPFDSAEKKTDDYISSDDSAEKTKLTATAETQTAVLPCSHADLKGEECLGNANMKKSDNRGTIIGTQDVELADKKTVEKSEDPVVDSRSDADSKDELIQEIRNVKYPVKAIQLKKMSPLLKNQGSKKSEACKSASGKTEGSPRTASKTKYTGEKTEEYSAAVSKIQRFLKSKETLKAASTTKHSNEKTEEQPKDTSKTRIVSAKSDNSGKILSKTKQACGKIEESVKTVCQTKHPEGKSRESTKTGNKSKQSTSQQKKV